MHTSLNGRTAARRLIALAAALAAGSLGCESVFHTCWGGGIYGPPYWARSVRAIPETARARFTANPIDQPECIALCGGGDVEHCEVASMESAGAERPVLVCFSYRKNGCPSGWGSGRLPEGLALDPCEATTLGDYFARAAALEAASVVSFRRLAADLSRHGAPASLVARAERAAREEKRHAKLARRLARRWNGPRVRARLEPSHPRTLVELAIENAREGCVGETAGCLLLHARAVTSVDAEVRGALRAIARDEIAHAALAWDVRTYLLGRLDDDGRVAERGALEAAERAARDIPIDPTFPFDPAPIIRALDEHVWSLA